MPSPSLSALFLEHVGPSMAKHLALLRAVEGLPCHIDLKRGEARFGDRHTFQVQLLGMEDQNEEIWTWSWALRESLVARKLTSTALTLKAWGEDKGLKSFSTPSFKTGKLRGDEIAILSCGLMRSESFLVADTELGTAYLLIPDLQDQVPAHHSAVFLSEVISEVLTTYDLQDHREIVRSLLRFEGYDFEEKSAEAWQARRSDGSRLSVTFDGQGRVSRLNLHEEAP